MAQRRTNSFLSRRIAILLGVMCFPVVITAIYSLILNQERTCRNAWLNWAVTQRMRIQLHDSHVNHMFTARLQANHEAAIKNRHQAERSANEIERAYVTYLGNNKNSSNTCPETIKMPKLDDPAVLVAIDRAYHEWAHARESLEQDLDTEVKNHSHDRGFSHFHEHTERALAAMDEVVFLLRDKSEAYLASVSSIITTAIIMTLFCLISTIYYLQTRVIRPFEKANNTVLQSEERFRRITSGTKDGLWEWYLATDEAWYSPQFARILDMDIQAIAPKRSVWEERLHPDDKERVLAVIRAAVNEDDRFDIECRLRSADGGYKWCRARGAVAQQTAEGNMVMSGTIQDITDEKSAELQNRIQLAALESAANAVIITDRDGHIAWINPAFTELTGYEAHEAYGRNPRFLKSGVHSPEFYQDLWRTILAGNTWHGELTNRRKDGQFYTEEMTITPVKEDGEKPTHFVAIKQDVSDRKRAEEQLGERARLAELSAAVNECLTWADNVNAILQRCAELSQEKLNAAFFRIWTVNQAENVLELKASAGMYTRINGTRARVQMGESKIGVIASEAKAHLTNDVLNDPLVLDKDWARREGFVSFAGHPLIVEGQVVGVMAMYARQPLSQYTSSALASISDSVAIGIQRKHSEAETARLNRELVNISRHAGMADIATGVLHNIGNALTGINTSVSTIIEQLGRSRVAGLSRAADLLCERLDDIEEFLTQDERGKQLPDYLVQLGRHLDEEQTDILKRLEYVTESVEHVNRIVATQQGYAKASALVEEIDVAELLEQVMHLHAGTLEGRRIEIRREFEDVPCLVADKHKLLQIVINLVRNAGHALGDCDRPDRLLKLCLEHEQDDHLSIHVIDNGIGIEPEKLTKIFAHGFTTKKDGHGFGLHSSALAAEEMGGSLTADSGGLGCGATFTLRLPIRPPGRVKDRDNEQPASRVEQPNGDKDASTEC